MENKNEISTPKKLTILQILTHGLDKTIGLDKDGEYFNKEYLET